MKGSYSTHLTNTTGEFLSSDVLFISSLVLKTALVFDRYVTACAFSPTAPIIATGSMDKSVNIWLVEGGASAHGGLILRLKSKYETGLSI